METCRITQGSWGFLGNIKLKHKEVKYLKGIYCIENLVNHKKYIGQSINIERRWKGHKTELKNHRHFNYHLQQSWNKYGEDNFEFTVIEECIEEDLDAREIYWIIKYQCADKEYGYNLTDGGSKGRQTEETRIKMSKARIGMRFSSEHVEHIRQARLGAKSTEATKAKLREIHKNPPVGENAPNAKLTNEQAKKIIAMLLEGIRICDIAKATKISYDVIKAIKQKRSWRHLTIGMSFPICNKNGRLKEVS